MLKVMTYFESTKNLQAPTFFRSSQFRSLYKNLQTFHNCFRNVVSNRSFRWRFDSWVTFRSCGFAVTSNNSILCQWRRRNEIANLGLKYEKWNCTSFHFSLQIALALSRNLVFEIAPLSKMCCKTQLCFYKGRPFKMERRTTNPGP